MNGLVVSQAYTVPDYELTTFSSSQRRNRGHQFLHHLRPSICNRSKWLEDRQRRLLLKGQLYR